MRLAKSLVRAKCRAILDDLHRIQKQLRGVSYESFVADEKRVTLCERYLERIINRAVDVNYHLVRARGQQAPNNYTKSFIKLGRLKILSAKLATTLAPSTETLNVLVHEYDDLDIRLFYTTLKLCIKQYPAYVRQIEKYLEMQ